MNGNLTSTPSGTSEAASTRKRELPSPFSPEDKQLKKNRAASGSSIGDIAEIIDPGETEPLITQTGILTLPDSELQKMCDLIQPSVENSVLESVRGDIRYLIKEAVGEVIDDKLNKLYLENKRLAQENTELKSRVTKLEQAVDEAEQYSRRNCIRISKIPERPDEDTDELVMSLAQSLNVRMSPSDIDRSHRIGRPGSKPHRDIIVKFVSYRARERLFINRKQLKDTEFSGVYLNEDLTRLRSKLLFEARKQVKAAKQKLLGAWSSNGKLLVKDLTGSIHKLSSVADLNSICGGSVVD